MLDHEFQNMVKISVTEHEKATKIVSNPIYKNVSKISVDNIIKETIVNDRYYLHQPPKNINNEAECNLIIFYHGSRDIAWTQILEYTNLTMINEKYIVAFGQASGTIEKPYIHPDHGYASFGEIFWDINDTHTQFTEDLLYTKALINDMQERYTINKIYFVGHSNGGVFALLLTLYMPNVFTGIVSHMGGIGYDPEFYLNFNLLQATDNKTPLLFYTGENDLHKMSYESAKKIFLSKGFPTEIFIEKNIGHEYLPNCEPYILEWFESL